MTLARIKSATGTPSMIDLRTHGLNCTGQVHSNLAPPLLVEMALERREGVMADNGALVAYTGTHTGRAARDKYVVREAASKDHVAWDSAHQPMEPEVFDRILVKVKTDLQGRELFVFDGWAGADEAERLAVRVIAPKAWHALFAHCLLLRPPAGGHAHAQPELTILVAPDLLLDPDLDGTRSETCVALSFERGLVLIAGTHYAGEIKKSVFTYLNYLLPQRGVLPMHCAANVGAQEDVALLFGLSGTGKTTLSADPKRRLIGDDEHGWSDRGVFNFEGGCYAKTINLSQSGEPQIWSAIRFGAILENVVLHPATRRPDYNDDKITENTRAGYPLEFIPGSVPGGRGGHPRHLLFLACDAFGVLPPLSKLTPDQALYHFLSGYTAKIAGTEAGVEEPETTFSACFGAPFLPLFPDRYARLLRARLARHQAQVWLVNTGWTGGIYGQGRRISLAHTRRLVDAVLNDELANAAMAPDPNFGVFVPRQCPGVLPELLQPRLAWKTPEEYDVKARRLAELFRNNFQKYAQQVPEEVVRAGPLLS
jgi:phosphoenolpyruvate carboxykinase (ATP)